MHKILVLMSTYNGAPYLIKQIESVFLQDKCNVTLAVADDCSTDDTLSILKNCRNIYSNIIIVNNSSNLGYPSNIYNLIRKVSLDNFDYIAYSDQDDFFMPNKFNKQIEELEKLEKNFVGVSTSVQCFGDSQRILNQSGKITKYDYLFEGAGQGCTFLMKAGFFKEYKLFITKNFNTINGFFYHDWLTYLFCRSSGYNWFFFHEPTVLYRIHKSNIAGSKYSSQGIILRLIKICDGWYYRQILIANHICLLINPKTVNLQNCNLAFLVRTLIFSGRRMLSDRVVAFFSIIYSKVFK